MSTESHEVARGFVAVFLLVWLWMAGCGGEFRVTTVQRGDTTTHTLSAGDKE